MRTSSGALGAWILALLGAATLGCDQGHSGGSTAEPSTAAAADTPPTPVAPASTRPMEGNERGSIDGPTTATGYDHPDQYLHLQAMSIAPNMEPVIQHPEQDQEARRRLASFVESNGGKLPNVVLFLLDDVGWSDFGFNGGGIAVGNSTPNIDRIASQGLQLTSAYSTPTCSPTRASIHTGQYPIHHGVLRPPMYGEPGGLSGVTLTEMLHDLGYTTQGIGKWHMGENEQSQPQNNGYDDYVGFLGVSDMYTEWRDTYMNPEIALSPARFAMMERMQFSKDEVHCVRGQASCDSVREINLSTISDLDNGWANAADQFIRDQASSDKPFFMYYGTRGCHFDNYPPDEFAGRSRARTVYSDCLVEMDSVFQRMMTALEESGQLENTIVFFTSDNGPEREIPPHGRTFFRGSKGSTWEGGMRVPTFVYWKGQITPRRSEGLFHVVDLLPTLVSIAGKPGAQLAGLVPATTYIDGIDQASFWLAEAGQSNRRSVIYGLNGQVAAVRVDEFKYHRMVDMENLINPTGDHGGNTGALIHASGVQVYNLYTNPQEDVGIAVRHLPATVPVIGEMTRYLQVLEHYPPNTQIGYN